jgi:hypothetical protein
MESKENSLLLTPVHRTAMIALIIVEHIGFLWGMLLYTNYVAFRLPFLNYSSIITAEGT